MVKRISGIQKQIFTLYRSLLREAAKKDRLQHQRETTKRNSVVPSVSNLLQSINSSSVMFYVRNEFRSQSNSVASRVDVQTIEHLIRKGHKQLTLLKMPEVQIVRRGH